MTTPHAAFARRSKPTFKIFAKPIGSNREAKFLNVSISASPTREEALAKVEKACIAAPEFRKMWQGYQLIPADVSEFIEISESGVVIRHYNQVQPVRMKT